MPIPSKIDALPSQIRTELDKRLIESGFGDHRGLSEWLAEQGVEIGKTAIGRYSQKLQKQIDALKLSHNFAMAYQFSFPDEDAAVPKMLNGLAQDCLYKVITKLHQQCSQLTDDSDLWGILRQLGMVTKSLSDTSRSEVIVSKYATELKERQAAKLAEIESEGTPKGITKEFMNRIKSEVLGLF